jgi:hypothetical protein
MKKISIFFLFIFCSCTTIKQLGKQEIKYNSNCSQLSIINNQILLDIDIENKTQQFLFDSGASISFLKDTTIIEDYKSIIKGKFGSAKSADNKKISITTFPLGIKNELFESKNKVFSFIEFPKTKCHKNIDYKGIIGLDLFFKNKMSLNLDFSNNKICNLTSFQFSDLLADKSYSLIKSESKNNQVFVFLKIENKEVKFKLDTGYLGNIVMPFNPKQSFINPNKIELEGSLYQTAFGYSNGLELLYEKMSVDIGNERINSIISISSSIKVQNIGIEFIKGFDWLIDYNNNKVYIKKNKYQIPSEFSKKINYYSRNNNDILIIVIKEKTQTKFNVGDEIISVNNTKVTSENICEMQELLNKTQDWNTLDLEVIPAKQ